MSVYSAIPTRFGGETGLVYIEDLSVARIKSPEERIKIGQNIQVKVKSVNKEENKIMLSYMSYIYFVNYLVH